LEQATHREVLLDVNDVALGHTPVMRWNDRDRWFVSKDLAHQPLIDDAVFGQAHTMLGVRARTSTSPKRTHRSRHPYIFISLVHCMREGVLIRPLDTWLVQELNPQQRPRTIAKLDEQAAVASSLPTATGSAGPVTAELDRKLARYRAALDAGADPAVVAGWIAETQLEREEALRDFAQRGRQLDPGETTRRQQNRSRQSSRNSAT
jgi:site-specific DNA recombinase